jgi:hypothetical protein
MDAIVQAHDGNVQMIDGSIRARASACSEVEEKVEIVVWGEAAAASRRRSTRASARKAVRSIS